MAELLGDNPADLTRLRNALFRVVNTIEAISTMYRSGFVPKRIFIEEFKHAIQRDGSFGLQKFIQNTEKDRFPSIKYLMKDMRKDIDGTRNRII